jgi:hypothetical protein
MSRFLVLGVLLAAAWAASAATIIQDDFESYADQAAFEAAWPPVSAGNAGTWSNAQAYSPTHSVFFPKTPATKNDFRNFAETVATDANPLEYSFRFYDSVVQNARNYVQLSDDVPTTNGQLVAIGNYNATPGATGAQMNRYYSARVLGVVGGGTAPGWFLMTDDPNSTTNGYRTVGWHEFKMVIKSDVIDFLVDGIVRKANVPYRSGTGVVSFDRTRLNSGLTSTNDAYIDDVLLQTTPEPAAFGLFVLGLGLLRRR